MNEHNNYGKLYFLWEHILWGAIMTFWYNTACFKVIGHLTHQLSGWIFYALILVCIAIGIAINVNHNRNGISVFIDLLIPFDIYTLLAYGRYMEKTTILSGILFLVLAMAYLLFLFRKPIHHIENERTIQKRRRIQGVRVLRAIAAVSFSLPIAVFAVSTFLGHSPITSSISAKGGPEWSEKYTISENVQTVSRLFDGSWETLAMDERMDILQTVANIERNYLGLPFELNVEARPLEQNVLAQYDHSRHRLLIDINTLLDTSGEEMLDSVCHEAYHAYQEAQVEAYQQVDDDLRNLRMFIYVGEYEEEFSKYKGDGSMAYYMQITEIKARQYAKEAVENYKSQIESYTEVS